MLKINVRKNGDRIMSFKKGMQKFWAYTWELLKMSFAPLFMYVAMSLLLVLLAFGKSLKFSTTGVVWWVVSLCAVLAYNGLTAYIQGSSGFEMLVSGNMRRMSEMNMDGGFKMSRYREVKEYRAWKGFVVGGILAVFSIVGAIIFGCNQSLIDGVFAQQQSNTDTGFGWVFVIFLLLSGWSSVLFLLLNTLGFGISYFYCLFFALLPVLVSGFLYIAGAYGKRRKTLKEQELKDRESQAQSAPKKINYGGLPGTKPKKRR